jgi:hypothetical protein
MVKDNTKGKKKHLIKAKLAVDSKSFNQFQHIERLGSLR